MSDSWKSLMKQADLLDNGSLTSPSSWNAVAKNGSGKASATPCFESHPKLNLSSGVLIGGSCTRGKLVDADIRVGLDWSMKIGRPAWPWLPKGDKIEFLFEINDGAAPPNIADFMELVTYLAQMLEFGKTVTVGCIGGHGRTGTVIVAIVALMYRTGLLADCPDQALLKDGQIIQWVRAHYCKKAVESQKQVDFLVTYFKVKPAEPRHHNYSQKGQTRDWDSATDVVIPAPSHKNVFTGLKFDT